MPVDLLYEFAFHNIFLDLHPWCISRKIVILHILIITGWTFASRGLLFFQFCGMRQGMSFPCPTRIASQQGTQHFPQFKIHGCCCTVAGCTAHDTLYNLITSLTAAVSTLQCNSGLKRDVTGPINQLAVNHGYISCIYTLK